MRKRQLIDVSLLHRRFSPSLSPYLPLFLKSISMSSGDDKKERKKLRNKQFRRERQREGFVQQVGREGVHIPYGILIMGFKCLFGRDLTSWKENTFV